MKLTAVLALFVFTAFVVPSQAMESGDSPAQQKIARAQQAIDRDPKRYQSYNELAMAFARRAREIGDPTYYKKADEALEKSFSLSPDNWEGLKTKVWVLLGKHEFAKALVEAKRLNRQSPDDIIVYGFLADSNIELGNYGDALDAAQWMLNMRPGNIPGLARGAYLRELFGDIDGALDFMGSAYQATPMSETEDRAWILTHMGHLMFATGKVDAAEKLLSDALKLFPGYHYALTNLAKVRAAQEKHPEAIELLRELVQAMPTPENLYLLAEELETAGRADEAKVAYAEFERKARIELEWADNANRELTFYYADHAGNANEALNIARKESERRHDVYTLDAYAWALHVNGLDQEARQQIETALKVGVRDPKLLYHAGLIASRLNDSVAATRYFQQSLAQNPVSEFAKQTREALAALSFKHVLASNGPDQQK